MQKRTVYGNRKILNFLDVCHFSFVKIEVLQIRWTTVSRNGKGNICNKECGSAIHEGE